MSSDSLRHPPKGAPAKVRESLPPELEDIRRRFVAFRHSLGWSQLRTAVELRVDPSTVERWETRDARKNSRIPSVHFDRMRRLAAAAGCDSDGKLRIA